MKRIITTIVAIFTTFLSLFSQQNYDTTGNAEYYRKFAFRSFSNENLTLPYREARLCQDENGMSALVIFLHSSSHRGDDNKSQMRGTALKNIVNYLENNKIKSIVIAPQCDKNHFWNDSDSKASSAVKQLIDKLIADSYGKYKSHIAVGLVGVPIFTEWAIRERQTDLMATILRQPDYPGYLNMIEQGATTTWESWDGDRSRVHNCYNGIGIWFYQALAGIRPDPDCPGYKHFFIDPQSCDGITWVKASKPTLFGTIRVEIEGNRMQVTVPSGTTATLFPGTDNERILNAGEWTVYMSSDE